jgi:hypothetical protein
MLRGVIVGMLAARGRNECRGSLKNERMLHSHCAMQALIGRGSFNTVTALSNPVRRLTQCQRHWTAAGESRTGLLSQSLCRLFLFSKQGKLLIGSFLFLQRVAQKFDSGHFAQLFR